MYEWLQFGDGRLVYVDQLFRVYQYMYRQSGLLTCKHVTSLLLNVFRSRGLRVDIKPVVYHSLGRSGYGPCQRLGPESAGVNITHRLLLTPYGPSEADPERRPHPSLSCGVRVAVRFGVITGPGTRCLIIVIRPRAAAESKHQALQATS